MEHKGSMTSRGRLLAAIRGEIPDKVPISPRLHPFLLERYGCACWLHYLKATRDFDFDPIILIQPWHHVKPDILPNIIAYPLDFNYTLLENVKTEMTVLPQDGNRWRVQRRFHTPGGLLEDALEILPRFSEFGIDPTPSILEPLLKEERDLDALPFLFLQTERLSLEDLQEIVEVVGERGLVEVQVDSAIDQRAGDLLGMESLMLAALDNPVFVHRLLHICQKQVLSETRAVLEAGAPMIFASSFYASMSAGWGPSHFREFFLPLLEEHIGLVHEYGAIFHYYDDGRVKGNLDVIVNAGADLISTLPGPPMGDVDIVTVKKRYGDRICLKGNVDLLHIMKQGTPEDVDRAVKEVIEAAAAGGRFILATSDAIRDGTPAENVYAFCEAGRKYGVYN